MELVAVKNGNSMSKGTASFGKRHTRIHGSCRRCGKHSFHLQKHECASCGYPSAKMRRYNWSYKSLRRRTQGTGSMSHMRKVYRAYNSGTLKANARKYLAK
ncbi:LSU ribosomal protein L37E [Giardia duodenalis]|nr:LSU ribosomal protein L37E [Giardia intestinalis]8FRU_j Chain j, 60S ribosomal protein eL37 [Giardia intestinalis assemblage A]